MDLADMSMMNEGSFSNAPDNATSFNLPEIWHFSTNGVATRVGQNLGPVGEFANLNRESTRKRRDCEDGDDDSAKGVSTSNGVSDCDEKWIKMSRYKNENHDTKDEAVPSSGKLVEQNAQPPPESAKQDYIHVRVRRGQATDSHSLAERARREKISERMKILQDLVPGCNKVIGKASVLDEIINYIQSLERQVEFLSMKLEAVNSGTPDFPMFPSKDFGQQAFDTSGMAFGPQATKEYKCDSLPEWLHLQVSEGFERTS